MVETEQIDITRICKLLGISRTTYYCAKDPKEAFEEKYLHLKEYIEKIIEKHSHYGVIRIKAELLREYDLTVGRDTLGKLLNLWGLDLRRKTRKSGPSAIKIILTALGERTNLLKRIQITKPLEALTSDVTEILFNGGNKKCYLCVHKDIFGQEVYGWELSLKNNTDLILDSFGKASRRIKRMLKRYGLKLSQKIIMHQDRGSNYTSYDYVNRATEDGLFRLSYSKAGTPTDNSGQESFFGRFKDEWKEELLELTDFREVKKFVEEKIRYYNEVRLHTSIGNVPPKEYTQLSLRNR